ncbi:MAG: hypothetical protein R3F07_00025 [Opitutaceae bacterium]
MNSPTASPKTIAKWPFFLGDAVFLAAMIALLALADRPISGSVAAAAVVCLICGVALTLIPFLIENENRVRLAETSGSASDGHHLRKLSALAEQLSNSVSRSQSSTEQVERALTSIEETNDRLADLVENLGRNTETAAPSGHDLTPVLEVVSGLAARLETVDGRLQELDRKTEHAAPPGHDPTPVLEMVSGLASQLDGIDRRLQELGRTGSVTPDDLKAALGSLSREIEARWLAWKETVPVPPPDPSPADNPIPGSPETAGPAEPESSPTATAAAKTEPRTREAKTRVRPTPRIKPEPRKPVGDDPNHDLAMEIPESTSARYVFNDRSTSIIATAYIGIGNKLTIRGTGPGLSWEKGVPMQFLSTGRWGWSALDVDEPVICRIYRNDEEPSLDGDIELQPTELKEVNPRF